MVNVIKLKRGEQPRANERYALVVVSSKPPKEGAAIAVREDGQTFFAHDNERDVGVIVARATAWAEENVIARVYLRRDRQ